MKPQEYIQSRTGKVIRSRRGYWAFIPYPLPPPLDWTPRLVSTLSAAAEGLGKLAATSALLPVGRACVRPFFRREARYSSSIAGLHTDPLDAYLAEATASQAPASNDPPEQVLEYEQALALAVRLAGESSFSLEGLKAVHARLAPADASTLAAPGEFRSIQNWVGPPGSTVETAPFVPPPAARLPALLADLESFARTATHLPPLIRIGLLHYQLEALHPFETGNGRTGRIYNSAQLAAWGGLPHPLLHLSDDLERQRESYFDHLLAVSRKSAWEAWLVFFLQGVIDAARATRQRLHDLNDLRERYRQTAAASRAADRLMAVVDHLIAQPVTNINRVAEALGVNFPAAQRYVDTLEAAGIVREITGQARNRLYLAEEILAIVDGGPSTRYLEITG